MYYVFYNILQPEAETKAEPEVAGGQITVLFSTISKTISPELVKKTQAVFQFNVKGISIKLCTILSML